MEQGCDQVLWLHGRNLQISEVRTRDGHVCECGKCGINAHIRTYMLRSVFPPFHSGGLDEHLHGDAKRLWNFYQTCHTLPSLWDGGLASTYISKRKLSTITTKIVIRSYLGSLVALCSNLPLKFPTWRSRKGSSLFMRSSSLSSAPMSPLSSSP